MWQVFSKQGYNNTFHRRIGIKPNDVNKNNKYLVLKRTIVTC